MEMVCALLFISLCISKRMASAMTKTSTTNVLKSVDGSKPGNSRKRQLANREAEMTASPDL